MKVMCMEQPKYWQNVIAFFGGRVPQVGDKCSVAETRRCVCGKHDLYLLEGYYLVCGFDPKYFAILPEADADEINAAEQEAIVPNPVVESDSRSVEEKAIATYYQVYELTGSEIMAAQAYWNALNLLP